MRKQMLFRLVRFPLAAAALSLGLAACTTPGIPGAESVAQSAAQHRRLLDQIDTVVVIYGENRSFDNLYGHFPGANGLQNLTPAQYQQRDRDGSLLPSLPVVWQGLTASQPYNTGAPPITQAETAGLANAPFAIDGERFRLPMTAVTRDLYHRFYENQMQIDGGKNDRFAAWADSGALVMGHYDGSGMALWQVARQYTLADNFHMGAFGSSFLNHFWLVCACTPYYPHADKSPAAGSISVVEPDGVSLSVARTSPASAMDGPPKFVNSGNLTPDFYAVNTMQPPYQPSRNKPAAGGDPAYADPANATTLPPQTAATIGDRLSARGIGWAWYGGAWQAALDGKGGAPVPNFQFHHQPFNYFANYRPGSPARAEHLRDGGLDGAAFIRAIDEGKLPQVAFYKPQGNLNEHAGYASVLDGDRHIAEVIAHLQKSPQWPHMLVIVTYDENGGFWDHAAPPKADRWGPGGRVPAIIVSPFAKRGYVDHTPYDTTSILRFVTNRFSLAPLPGVVARDAALAAHGNPPMGDLSAALTMPAP